MVDICRRVICALVMSRYSFNRKNNKKKKNLIIFCAFATYAEYEFSNSGFNTLILFFCFFVNNPADSAMKKKKEFLIQILFRTFSCVFFLCDIRINAYLIMRTNLEHFPPPPQLLYGSRV